MTFCECFTYTAQLYVYSKIVVSEKQSSISLQKISCPPTVILTEIDVEIKCQLISWKTSLLWDISYFQLNTCNFKQKWIEIKGGLYPKSDV